jgi:hypothetical protein
MVREYGSGMVGVRQWELGVGQWDGGEWRSGDG